MNVDAGDRQPQPVQHLSGVQRGVFGGCDEVRHGLGDERSRAASRVQHFLVQRVGYHLPHHRARQPGRRIVLAKLPPLVRRDDRLVQNCGNVGRDPRPVEPGHAPRQRPQRRQPSGLCRPRKEVGLDDPLQAGIPLKAASQQQVRRVVKRKLLDIDSKRSLHHHADYGAQVGVAHEEVVQRGLCPGNLAERRKQKVTP